MQRLPFHLKACLVASVSMFASSCATPGPIRLSSPSAQTFQQEPKPVPSIDILVNDDGEALRRHQRDKDDWGQRGWDRVNAICHWFQEQGVDDLPCTPDAEPIQPR